jgi:hypothetical protein
MFIVQSVDKSIQTLPIFQFMPNYVTFSVNFFQIQVPTQYSQKQLPTVLYSEPVFF